MRQASPQSARFVHCNKMFSNNIKQGSCHYERPAYEFPQYPVFVLFFGSTSKLKPARNYVATHKLYAFAQRCAYILTNNEHAYFVIIVLFRFGFNALARYRPEFSNWHGACETDGNFP
jgi:hypothetical protein